MLPTSTHPISQAPGPPPWQTGPSVEEQSHPLSQILLPTSPGALPPVSWHALNSLK